MTRHKTGTGRTIARYWTGMTPRLRLLTGSIVVITIGLVGLTPKTVFGFPIAWPYAGLIAAIGWGRTSLAFGPVIVLIVTGFAQDSTQAPWGSHALANLLTYGIALVSRQFFSVHKLSNTALVLPFLQLFAGISIVWILASLTNTHPVPVAPVLAAFLTTATTYIIIEPLFDLGKQV